MATPAATQQPAATPAPQVLRGVVKQVSDNKTRFSNFHETKPIPKSFW